MGTTVFYRDSTDNPLPRHKNHWWGGICRKSTCDFESMGRCSANHHKPQGFFSTYVEIMVALQMEQIQTKDWQMEIAPMVSCHSWHYRLCSLFIPIKAGLWILTEPTASFTRRSSWMKRERGIIKSWIHLSIPIHSSRHTGDWIIKVRVFTHNILF